MFLFYLHSTHCFTLSIKHSPKFINALSERLTPGANPRVNFQSAQMVSFQSAPTMQKPKQFTKTRDGLIVKLNFVYTKFRIPSLPTINCTYELNIMLSFSQIDTSLLININLFLIRNEIEFKIISQFGQNLILRGFPIFVMLVSLWFLPNLIERRSRILVGLLATCFATALSVSFQFQFTPHIRPILDTSVHLNFVKIHENIWGRLGSFPSDTATLFFSLCAVIFLENRRAGIFCLMWAMITVGVFRIALGYHYPSDIAGSFVLGFGLVLLLNSVRWLKTLFAQVLKRFEYKEYIVHSFFFIFLADAYSSFGGLEALYKGLKKLISIIIAS